MKNLPHILSRFYLFFQGAFILVKSFLGSIILIIPLIILYTGFFPEGDWKNQILSLVDFIFLSGALFFSSKYLQIPWTGWKIFSCNYKHLMLALGLYSLYAILLLPILEKINLPTYISQEIFLKPALNGNVPMILMICLIGPVFEELIFRGLYLEFFLRRTTPLWAILYSALLFSIMHLNPSHFPETLAAGILFGYLYYRTGSLTTPALVHILHNSLVLYGYT